MLCKVFISLTLVTGLVAQQTSNCPNSLAAANFQQRTTCTNNTYFIVPVDKTLVQAAVGSKYPLLPLPTNDPTVLPNGFPAGEHPVVITTGLDSDIRMNTLQLSKNLFQGSIIVPYVDYLKDGRTPFRYNVKSYIGGVNDDLVNSGVPAVVGTLGGTTLFIAQFVPNNNAFQQVAGSSNEYFAQIKQVVVPNPVSGPGVIPEAVDTDFFTAGSKGYPLKFFKEGINQPLILNNGLTCQRNPIFFNETFTRIVYRTGKVTLYEPGGAFKGTYTNVPGFSGEGGQIGYNPESCQDANARNTDPNLFSEQ